MESPSSPQETDAFMRLLEAMPSIADAVNKFESPKNQRVALDALIRAVGLPGPAVADSEQAGGEAVLRSVPTLSRTSAESDDQPGAEDSAVEPGAAPTKAPMKKKARKSGARSYARVDVDFRPAGKVALRDFFAEKDPQTYYERNTVFVYYLEQILEIGGIEVGHVLAAYDHCSIKPPSQPDNSLATTAAAKRWLLTSDMKAIKTSHNGRSMVEYDLPRAKDEKSA